MSSDLRSSWGDVCDRVRRAEFLCILSDFDGTLAPIVDHPERAWLPAATRRILERLALADNTAVGLISGRGLTDLVARGRIRSIWYAGCHGFEIQDPRERISRFYDADDLRQIGELHEQAMQELEGLEGIELENKGPVLTLHLRRASAADAAQARSLFTTLIGRREPLILPTEGRLAVEARIRKDHHKGTALRYIRSHLPLKSLVFYFGDDATDRDAFTEIAEDGIAVKVGVADILAPYTLPGVEAVAEVLGRLAEAAVPH